jgi:predicted nucleotidyltransferase
MGTSRGTRKINQTATTSVSDALFSKVQQRVLGLLFGNPGRSFYANEIIALANSGTGAVQRELVKLESAGLITSSRVGNQRHYKANPATPVFKSLRELVLKTSGIADILRAALAPAAAAIRAAFVYGSVAKGSDRATSDVDVMIVSDTLTYSELFELLENASRRIGRSINPTIYSARELTRRLRVRNAFVTRIVAQPKIWLIGSEDDLAAG